MNASPESLCERLRPGLTPAEEAELYSVCVHEAAHSFAAARLGLESDTLVVSANCGICVHGHGSTLQNAIVSWAGVMAEALLNTPHKSRTLPKTKLTGFTIHRWVDEVRLYELSKEDREGIEGHDSLYHPARAAFEILIRNLDILEYLTHSLADRSREKFRQSKDMPHTLNEWELDRFASEWHEKRRAKVSAESLLRATAEADALLASLPPCRIPDRFNYDTFLSSTGATEAEIVQFVSWQKTRERNEVGLGPPSEKCVEAALKFFKTINTRGDWIAEARKLYKFRNETKGAI